MTELKMTFALNTIDHLGVKLYNSFPPVIAELVSNSYDAEANKVSVEINYTDKIVKVIDNGHGMTFDEVNQNFLVIGRNRRMAENNGLSRNGKRQVTGKKGLGKLAVFGIAEDITVISVSNKIKNEFTMNYQHIKEAGQSDANIAEYKPNIVHNNMDCDENDGTTIILSGIKIETITNIQDLSESLSNRFQIFDEDFEVKLSNLNRNEDIVVTNEAFHRRIEIEYEWEFPQDFTDKIAENSDLSWLVDKNVTGHVITKKTPLAQQQTGIIIYARKKLVQEKTFFNDRSNDLFNTYVTGYFNADFIDDSNNLDLVATDRKSLLWGSDDEAIKLRECLDKIMRIISQEWRIKRLEEKDRDINEMLPENFYEGVSGADKSILENVKKQLVKNLPGESDTSKIIELLTSFKQQFQFETFKDYVITLNDEEMNVENMQRISHDWELIEKNEMAKIALGRTETIKKFEEFINTNSSETKVIQPFLEKFPWILEPRMTTFDREVTFSRILKENFPEEDLDQSNRRIDFLCTDVNGNVIIIELKRPNIKISMKEIGQALEYRRFLLEKRRDLKSVTTYLISDRYDMDAETKDIYEELHGKKLTIKTYTELITQAKNYHKHFIELQEEISRVKMES